jgi:hypothetical protein
MPNVTVTWQIDVEVASLSKDELLRAAREAQAHQRRRGGIAGVYHVGLRPTSQTDITPLAEVDLDTRDVRDLIEPGTLFLNQVSGRYYVRMAGRWRRISVKEANKLRP